MVREDWLGLGPLGVSAGGVDRMSAKARLGMGMVGGCRVCSGGAG